MTKPTIKAVNAVSIETSIDQRERVEAVVDVYSRIMSEEIIVDTRSIGDDDGSLAILANILEVAEDDIRDRLVCLYG